MKLEGLVAIVTGGSSGIGAGISTVLCSHGCKVVLANTSEKNGKDMETKLGNDKAFYVKTDMSKEEDIKNVVEQAVKKFGAIHIIVNNTGVSSFGFMSMPTFTYEEMLRVYNINVFGPLLLNKYASLLMMKQKPVNELGERGVLINIGSVTGFDGIKGLTIYASSKGAVNSMTLPLARELGKFGIRVVTLVPGTFPTAMTEMIDDKIMEIYKKDSALQRLGDPREVGDAVVSLVENSYITGTTIRIDGGVRPRM